MTQPRPEANSTAPDPDAATGGAQRLIAALAAFYQSVAREPLQPLNQLAEEAVQHWVRVLDGHDIVQPRLDARGYAPTAFHFGMELQPANRLDACEIAAGPAGFAAALDRRLEGLRTQVTAFFERSGYRSSADQCDRMMLELARLSRFVNAWAAEGEAQHRRRWHGRAQPEREPVDLYAPLADDDFLGQVRWQLALWEPFLNAVIVGWDENRLDYFERALQDVRALLEAAPDARAERFPPPGYPLRRRASPRQKAIVLEPEQRPLRSRSVLWVRYDQLLHKAEAAGPEYGPLLEELAGDVLHFRQMVDSNLFLLAATPGFLERGRPGIPVIRNSPTTHPIFLDPIGFFKKAVLFHNGTYTVAGGGLDVMYLQLRQLERFARFERWGGWSRPLRVPLEASLIAWEENRWDGFTESLLQVAEHFRREAEEGDSPPPPA